MPFEYNPSGAMMASAPVMGFDDKLNGIIASQATILKMLQEMQGKMRHGKEGSDAGNRPNKSSKRAMKASTKVAPPVEEASTKVAPPVEEASTKVAPPVEEAPAETPDFTNTPAEMPANNAPAEMPANNAPAEMPANNAPAEAPANNNQAGGRRKTPRQKRKGRASRKA